MGTGGGHVPMILHNDRMVIYLTFEEQEGEEVDIRPDEVVLRRLTPLEVWKIMGFSEEDFNSIKDNISNTQIYKQVGNSIAVSVLEGIIKEIL